MLSYPSKLIALLLFVLGIFAMDSQKICPR